MGYMSATVEPVVQIKKKKLKLTYKVSSGKPYKIRSLKYDIRDEKSENICGRIRQVLI